MNLLKEGYRTVIDADIKSYFDNLDFGKLMKLIEERICDKKVLKLIEQFLKQDIVDDMNRWSPESGTPQGAVISPLLANIYLHPFDVTLEQTGAKMVRYADDFIVFCKSNEEAENILKEIKTWMADACLQLHPDKTSIVDLRKAGAGFDFLGYHFQTTKSTKRITKWPSDKSIKKLKSKIQPLTRRCNGFSMHRNVQKINEIFMGWFEYFKHSGPTGFERLDSWVRQRLRAILKKRQKRKGIAKGADFKRWPLSYFEKLGLFSLKKNHDLLRQSLWSNC